MRSLLAQMVALWRTVDLDDLKGSLVMEPTTGFLPTRRELEALGLGPTADDLINKTLTRAALNDLNALTQALRSPGGGMPLLNRLADTFSTSAARGDGLVVSEYGTILALPEYQMLMAQAIPAFYEALMEEVAQVVGIPRRAAPVFVAKNKGSVAAKSTLAERETKDKGGVVAKSTLAELAVTGAVGYIVDKILDQGVKTFKNAKQYARDVIGQAAWGSAVVAFNAHLKQFAQGQDIHEVVSGASLSFRVFEAPYTFIEVNSNDEPDLNEVMIIGPDITSALGTGITTLLEELKAGFSLGKKAAENPQRYRSQREAQKTVKGLRKKAKEIQDATQELFDIVARMYQTPTDAEYGCIFTADPACVQLHFENGIKSVYRYSPPPGFGCFSGLPLPIPILVQDQLSGLMYFANPAFLPTPKIPGTCGTGGG